MGKLYTYLLVIGALTFSITRSAAQVALDFSPTAVSVEVGDTVTLSAICQEFTPILGLQGTISWNENNFSFLDIPQTSINLNGLTAPDCTNPVCSFNSNFINEGDIPFTWFSPIGESVANGTSIFQIRFIALAESISPVTFTNEKNNFLATVEGANGPSDVVPDSDPAQITIGTGNPPVLPGFSCDSINGFGLYIGSDSIATGEHTCLEVKACGFVDLYAMGYTLQFDPSLLQFDSIANFNVGAGTENFGEANVDQGLISALWFHDEAVTVPDETVIYSICFTAIGEGGKIDSIKINSELTPLQAFSDLMGTEVSFSSNPGTITILGTANSAVSIFTKEDNVNEGENICMPLQLKDFDDMRSLDFTLEWDETILDFTGINDPNNFFGANLGTQVDASTALTNSGALTVQWVSPTPVTHPDSLVFLEVCYDGIGAGAEVSDLDFTSGSVMINATQEVTGTAVDIPVVSTNGKVTIVGSSDFVFTLSDPAGCVGDTVTVDFVAQGWNLITNMRFLLNWDTTELQWLGLHDNILPNFFIPNTSPAFTSAGKMSLLWFDENATGLTYMNGEVLFQMDFIVKDNAAMPAEIIFTSDPSPGGVQIEVGDFATGGLIPFDINNGFVTCASTSISIAGAVTDVKCKDGDDGAIDLTVTNGMDPVTFSWVGPGTFTSSSEDLTDLAAGVYSVTVTNGNSDVVMGSYTMGEPAALGLSATSESSGCNGNASGAIDLTVSGGTLGYTFSWTGPASFTATTEDLADLAAGEYCVTLTDANNCTEETCVTVDETVSPTLTFTTTDASCNGGTNGAIDLTVADGTPGFTYLWADGETTEDRSGLSVGEFCVTVTDSKECTAEICITISEDGAPVVTGVAEDISCHGNADGSINISVSGGSPDYTFAWSNMLGTDEDQTDLDPGTYTVSVTDMSSCQTVESFDIAEPDELIVTGTSSNVSCFGEDDGAIDLSIAGGTGSYTVSWDNGAGSNEDPTDLGPNTYTVSVLDDNMCPANATFTITEPDEIVITGDVTNDSGANDGAIDVSVSGGAGGFTFTWMDGPTSEDRAGLDGGSYTIVVSDVDGCENTATFEVGGIEDLAVTLESITEAGCAGADDGVIDISVTGGISPYTFLWNDDAASVTEDVTDLDSDSYSVTVMDNVGNTVVGGPYFVDDDELISFTELHTDALCATAANGTITLDITGGVGPFVVEWDNTPMEGAEITGLSAGTYTPSISDSQGCGIFGSPISIGAPNPLSINDIQIVNLTCNNGQDGSIAITVVGGTPDYTITWSGTASTGPSISNLGVGFYTPTIEDANGCILTGNPIEVTQPKVIIGGELVTHISCAGEANGTIALNPTGGNGGYTFAWTGSNGFMSTAEDISDLAPGTYDLIITDSEGCTGTIPTVTINDAVPISASANIQSASFTNDDGAIALTVTGGTPGYNFNWTDEDFNTYPDNNVISDLSSGVYTVTISDANQCSIVETYMVSGSIGVVGVVTDVSCFGLADGSIELDPITGGLEPYTFDWSSPASGQDLLDVPAGIYSVTVTDANGVIEMQTFTVNEPTEIVVTLNQITNETGQGCNGGVDVGVVGGEGPYTYQWNNGASSEDLINVCKGSFTLTVTDINGCVIVSPEYEVGPAQITVTNTNIVNVPCFGMAEGEVCLEYFGGCSPYNITIDGINSIVDLGGEICFSDLAAGNHIVSIVDNLGESLDYSFNLVESPEIILSTIITNNTDDTGLNCNGAINLTVVGGAAPFTFQWSHGPSSEDVSGLCEDLSPYSVTVTDANGCFASLTGLEVDLGIAILGEISGVCDLVNCDGSIDIDITGGLAPYAYSWTGGASSEDLFGICAGNFTVTVTDASGMTETQSFVVAAPNSELSVSGNVSGAGLGSNGAINTTTTGGYGGYMYNWSSGQNSPSIAGLMSGVYVLTVTDNNGCLVVESFEIIGADAAVSFDVDQPTCFGSSNGCAQALPLFGTVPYTYVWSNGQAGAKICNLMAGEYNVTVTDANGQVGTETIVVDGPAQLTIEIEDLGNGSLQALASGGTPTYSYSWNDPNGSTTAKVDDLTPGTYDLLVVDDNGCIANASFSILTEGDCVDVRKIISPNGDGDNDEFVILCAYTFVENELQIFNRWGQLVYNKAGYDNSWNGITNDGAAAAEGGYFYVFRYTDPGSGQQNEARGSLTLIR